MPPSFAAPDVSQPEQRNVQPNVELMSSCSSGNIPFWSASALEISYLIPICSVPTKTEMKWERECSRMGG